MNDTTNTVPFDLDPAIAAAISDVKVTEGHYEVDAEGNVIEVPHDEVEVVHTAPEGEDHPVTVQ